MRPCLLYSNCCGLSWNDLYNLVPKFLLLFNLVLKFQPQPKKKRLYTMIKPKKKRVLIPNLIDIILKKKKDNIPQSSVYLYRNVF